MAFFVALAIIVPTSEATALPGDLLAEVIVDDLQFPVKMESLGGGDFLVTEKMGQVRLIRDGELLAAPVARFDVKAQNEAGLLDVVLTPNFAETGDFLISYTPQDDLEAIYVSRLRLDGDSATILDDPWIELPSIPSTDRHFAGTLSFDSSGQHLFISIGDLRDETFSQDPDSLPGSVLRYNADGTIPDDNPFGSDNPVFAYGLRNPFGIFVDPDDNIFAVGNSDDVNDELNLIESGKNYGWPIVEGICDNFPRYQACESHDFEDPIFEFRTVNGPTSILRYHGEMIPDFEGDLMVTGWHSSAVHHLSWDGPGSRTVDRGILFTTPSADAGFTDIVTSQDGAIFVLESSASGGALYRIARAAAIQDPDRVVENNNGGCSHTNSQGHSFW